MGMCERIFDLAARKFKDQQDFAAAIGAPPSRISGWKTGRSTSYNKYLPELAEALDTTIDYLLTGEEQKAPAGGAADERILQFAKALAEAGVDLNGLTDRELRRVARIAAASLEK